MRLNFLSESLNQTKSICHQHLETEAKWSIRGHLEYEGLRAQLRWLGAESKGLHKEINHIFDNISGQLEKDGKILRLRFVNNATKAVLTLKTKAKLTGHIKERPEAEIEVENGHVMQCILEELGFSITTEYFKTRETWLIEDAEVMLDELPFGHYCEIEGSKPTILKLAKALTLSLDDCETRDYPTMMREYIRNQDT